MLVLVLLGRVGADLDVIIEADSLELHLLRQRRHDLVKEAAVVIVESKIDCLSFQSSAETVLFLHGKTCTCTWLRTASSSLNTSSLLAGILIVGYAMICTSRSLTTFPRLDWSTAYIEASLLVQSKPDCWWFAQWNAPQREHREGWWGSAWYVWRDRGCCIDFRERVVLRPRWMMPYTFKEVLEESWWFELILHIQQMTIIKQNLVRLYRNIKSKESSLVFQ